MEEVLEFTLKIQPTLVEFTGWTHGLLRSIWAFIGSFVSRMQERGFSSEQGWMSVDLLIA